MKTFGKILFFLGVLSLVLGIIGAVLAGTTFKEVSDFVDQQQSIEGSTTVSMDEDETRMLLGPDADSSACTVQGATLGDLAPGTSAEVNNENILGTITADTAGDVTVTCSEPGYALSGPADMGAFMKLGLGLAAAIFLIPLGLLLMLVGGLLWFFGRRKNKQQQYSSYTNGEYSDQYARSTPYSQRNGQVPPAPAYGQVGTNGAPGYQPDAYGQNTTGQSAPPAPGYGLNPSSQPEYGQSAPPAPEYGHQAPSTDAPASGGATPAGQQDWNGSTGSTGQDDQSWNRGGSTPPPPPGV